MYLAAATREAGIVDEIRIVESSMDCPTDTAFVQILEDFRPDVVGLRSIVFFEEELQRLARLTRSHSDAAIVVGGPVVQAWKAQLFAKVPEADVAVKGEGEWVFPQLLQGRAFADLPGTLYRDGDRIVESADATAIADLDALPLPAYDLVDLDRYAGQLSYAYNHRRQGVLVTSRGCVYSCTFCFRAFEGLRLRSAGSVFEEITELHDRYGIRDFYIVDDIFNVSVRRALEIFDRIIASTIDVRLYFVNGLRADTVTTTFVDRALAAGAIWFTFAVESASEDIQRQTRKNVDLARAKSIIAYTQRKGVVVNISTMFGFPGETAIQAQQTLDWLGELPRASLLPYHFCLRFFPGCEIWDQALAAGFTADQLEASAANCFHDMPSGTPTLSRAEMTRIAIAYQRQFGVASPERIREAIGTLSSVGYSDSEIAHLYSVLLRRPGVTVAELVAT
jgi:radical SAM superfamily enzyme YgiQ (UPF0313 family)